MAFGDTTVLTGKSGAEFTFTIFPRQSRFQPNAGLYVMGRDTGGRRFEFCFVGHTDNLSVRPFNKEKASCFSSFGVDHIFILVEPDARRRAQIAEDLIQAYVPTCNTL